MKIIKRVLLVVLCIVTIYCGASYLMSYNMHKTAEYQAIQKVKNLNDQIVTISLSGSEYTKKYGDLVDISYEITYPYWAKSFFEDYSISINDSLREEQIKKWVLSLKKDSVDAGIAYSEEIGWMLIKEEDDQNIDVTPAIEYVKGGLRKYNTEFDLNEFLMPAVITSDFLQEYYYEVSWMNDFEISYGNQIYIDKDYLYPYVDNFEISVDDIDLSEFRDKLIDAYDTTDNSVNFVTTNGGKITVPFATYGYSVNLDKECEEVINAIESHESLKKDSPYLTGYDDLWSEYIEVSLNDQHVWHYVDGELCCEADCVTGLKNKRDTPTGVYYITEKVNGKYLTGPTWRSWVNKWMRLTNSGVGLHDATWRSKFGGSIYTYDGSHGCINLPKSYAYSLYDEVSVGCAVIIY